MMERTLIWYSRRFPVSTGKLRVVNRLWRVASGPPPALRTGRLIYAGYQIPCDLSETIQRQIFFFGTYYIERECLECWVAMTRDARVIFDVGANAGIYSLAGLAANPHAVVHAFEPTSEIAERLRATATLNHLPTLHVHELAILSRAGAATLHRCRGDYGDNGGMNFITSRAAPTGESVSATTLDAFCSEKGIVRIDALKMDIQGQEAAALEGARGLLAQGRISSIFFELNWSTNPGERCVATAAVEMLSSYGFQFAEPRRPLRWQAAGTWMRKMTEIIARQPIAAAGAK
jgi:FkbM family methyltransferase